MMLSAYGNPIRVACVGDSITYGDQLPDRSRQAYPAVLQRLSEGRYLTGNFGVSGATALQGIWLRSWLDTRAARAALAFAPDRVVIMLGINDLAYPARSSHYPADLREIVRRFQALPQLPQIYLCTLTPIAPIRWETPPNRTIREVMNPAIRAVAAETGARLIDITAAFPARDDLLPDGLHPNPEGAEIIARTVLAALDGGPPQIQAAPIAGPVAISIRHEAREAIRRAEQWLQTHSAAGNEIPAPPPAPPPENLPELLRLLTRPPPEDLLEPYALYAQLATLLAERGEETVFLPNGQPFLWREALLHQLVQQQRRDAAGAGFWRNPVDPPEDSPAIARATAAALRALHLALGPD